MAAVGTSRPSRQTATENAGSSSRPHHQKHHVEEIYTPPDENGKMERTILPVAGGPATRMGRESACRSGPLGPIFFAGR